MRGMREDDVTRRVCLTIDETMAPEKLSTVKVKLIRPYLERAGELAERLAREQPALVENGRLDRNRVIQLAIHIGLDELAAARPRSILGGGPSWSGPERRRR